jgi:hypothetical protein
MLAPVLAPIVAVGHFQFRNMNSTSIELTENGAPVFVYHYGRILKEGVAPDRARC